MLIGSNGRPHVKLILWVFSSGCDKKVDSVETKTTWLFIGIGAGVNVVLVLAIGIGIAMRARARYGVSRSCLMPSELSIGNATFFCPFKYGNLISAVLVCPCLPRGQVTRLNIFWLLRKRFMHQIDPQKRKYSISKSRKLHEIPQPTVQSLPKVKWLLQEWKKSFDMQTW